MKTVMSINRLTVIPYARFWQETFLVSLAKPKQGVNGAAVDADAASKLLLKRRSKNQRRREDFQP